MVLVDEGEMCLGREAVEHDRSSTTQAGRRLSLMTRTTSLLRFGLILTVPALLALTGLTASPASAATRITRPSAPRHVTAVAGDNTAIVVFIAPASNGGSRVSEYYVKEYGRSSAIRRCAGTHCSILGLSNGVGYRFAVAAINKFGRSTYSAPSNIITPTAPVSTTPPPTSTGTTTAAVTFNANGGSGAMADEIESVNTATALSPNSFVYSGYAFSEWNTSPTGAGTSYANDSVYPFAASVTLYAQWTASTIPFTGQVSSNWSGYVLPTSAPVTLASGEWTVPTLNCASTPNGSTGTWVGIGDGGNSGALLQTGVNEVCVDGAQENFGFWEIYPATPNHSESYSDFPVNAGDTMIGSVAYVNGEWATVIEDLDTGLSGYFVAGNAWEVVTTSSGAVVGSVQGTATGYAYSGGYSAEWIQEDVTNANSGSLYSFPDYGSVTFTELKVLPSGYSLSSNDGVEVTSNGAFSGVAISVPGPYDGSSFTVTYTGS